MLMERRPGMSCLSPSPSNEEGLAMDSGQGDRKGGSKRYFRRVRRELS